MKKEKLKRLKKELETKVYIEDAFSATGPITLYEINKKIDTTGAVENIENYFKKIITYFSIKNIKYDEITLRCLFSIIVKEEDLDQKTIIKTNSNPLKDLVVLKVNGFYCKNKEQTILEDPDIIYENNFNEYIISLDDFIKIIIKSGLDFNGFNTIEEIKQQILRGQPTFGNITLKFSKKKTKKK